MRLLVLMLAGGAGAMLVYQLSQDKMLFYVVIGAGLAGTLFLVSGFAFAMVLRYARPAREAAPRPASPAGYIIDQPGPYQALPSPRREPLDSGRLEMLPTHFTDMLTH